MDLTRALGRSYLFQDLGPDALQHLAGSLSVRRFRPGEHVFRCGDVANEVWVVVSGQVREYTLDDDGNEYIYELLGPSAVFGEPSTFASERSRVVNELAVVPTVAASIDRAVLLDLMSMYRDVLLRLLEGLASEVRIAVEEVPRAVRSTVYARVVDRLVVLMSIATPDPMALPFADLKITQSELARMAGCTRENANRALSELARQGLVEITRGSVLVREPGRLQAISRLPEWVLRRRNTRLGG